MKIKMPNLTAEEVDQKIAAAVADWDQQLDALVEEKVDEKIAAAIEEKIEAAIQEERKAVYHNKSMIKQVLSHFGDKIHPALESLDKRVNNIRALMVRKGVAAQ